MDFLFALDFRSNGFFPSCGLWKYWVFLKINIGNYGVFEQWTFEVMGLRNEKRYKLFSLGSRSFKVIGILEQLTFKVMHSTNKRWN